MVTQYTIAYVNPDHLAGELMTFSLDSAQTQVWSFADAEELMRSLRSANFDCVLAANLPVGDMLDLECALHDSGHHLPVIGVSESTDVQALVDSLRYGRTVWGSSPAV